MDSSNRHGNNSARQSMVKVKNQTESLTIEKNSSRSGATEQYRVIHRRSLQIPIAMKKSNTSSEQSNYQENSQQHRNRSSYYPTNQVHQQQQLSTLNGNHNAVNQHVKMIKRRTISSGIALNRPFTSRDSPVVTPNTPSSSTYGSPSSMDGTIAYTPIMDNNQQMESAKQISKLSAELATKNKIIHDLTTKNAWLSSELKLNRQETYSQDFNGAKEEIPEKFQQEQQKKNINPNEIIESLKKRQSTYSSTISYLSNNTTTTTSSSYSTPVTTPTTIHKTVNTILSDHHRASFGGFQNLLQPSPNASPHSAAVNLVAEANYSQDQKMILQLLIHFKKQFDKVKESCQETNRLLYQTEIEKQDALEQLSILKQSIQNKEIIDTNNSKGIEFVQREQNEPDSIMNYIELLETKLNDLKSEKFHLENKLSLYTRAAQSYKESKLRAEACVVSLEEDLEKAKLEIRDLQTELRDLQDSNELEKENQELKSKLREKDETIDFCTEVSRQQEMKIRELQNELNNLKSNTSSS